MSVWVESEDDNARSNHASMTDVIFKIQCQSLPVDHAEALSESLCSQQPDLKTMHNAGVHPIHVAGSQNGWQRPDNDDQPLILSKRTRLKIRVDSAYSEQLIRGLKNTSHVVNGHKLTILDGRTNHLQPVTTLFSRACVYLNDQDTNTNEDLFVECVISDCKTIGYQPTKILCGLAQTLTRQGVKIMVRSVLLADVPLTHSLALQDKGLGDLRLIGCGLLIPHKDTAAVNQPL